MIKQASVWTVLAVLCIAMPVFSHNIDTESLAFRIGVLNWLYPDSLHVRAPIWDAQQAGILPQQNKSRMNAVDARFNFQGAVASRRKERALRALGAAVGSRATAGQPVRFSMVLVESAFWVQFAVSPEEQILEIEADGPNHGDLVAVTGEPVIYAMREGKLPLIEAVESGMMKLYGEPVEIDRFLAAYGDVGAETMPDPSLIPGQFSISGRKATARAPR